MWHFIFNLVFLLYLVLAQSLQKKNWVTILLELDTRMEICYIQSKVLINCSFYTVCVQHKYFSYHTSIIPLQVHLWMHFWQHFRIHQWEKGFQRKMDWLPSAYKYSRLVLLKKYPINNSVLWPFSQLMQGLAGSST